MTFQEAAPELGFNPPRNARIVQHEQALDRLFTKQGHENLVRRATNIAQIRSTYQSPPSGESDPNWRPSWLRRFGPLSDLVARLKPAQSRRVDVLVVVERLHPSDRIRHSAEDNATNRSRSNGLGIDILEALVRLGLSTLALSPDRSDFDTRPELGSALRTGQLTLLNPWSGVGDLMGAVLRISVRNRSMSDLTPS